MAASLLAVFTPPPESIASSKRVGAWALIGAVVFGASLGLCHALLVALGRGGASPALALTLGKLVGVCACAMALYMEAALHREGQSMEHAACLAALLFVFLACQPAVMLAEGPAEADTWEWLGQTLATAVLCYPLTKFFGISSALAAWARATWTARAQARRRKGQNPISLHDLAVIFFEFVLPAVVLVAVLAAGAYMTRPSLDAADLHAPSMAGKTALITDAAAPRSAAHADFLLRAGAAVVLCARNRTQAQAIADAAAARTGSKLATACELDLASFASVLGLGRAWEEEGRPLHVLVLAADEVGGGAFEATEDGAERVMQVNFLAQQLLADLLLPSLMRRAPARIVHVVSEAHRWGSVISLAKNASEKAYKDGLSFWSGNYYGSYADAKLMQVMSSMKMARELAHLNVTSHAVNPGTVVPRVHSGMSGKEAARALFVHMLYAVGRIFGVSSVSEEESAVAQIHASVSPSLQLVSGLYLSPDKAPFEGCVTCAKKFHRCYRSRILSAMCGTVEPASLALNKKAGDNAMLATKKLLDSVRAKANEVVEKEKQRRAEEERKERERKEREKEARRRKEEEEAARRAAEAARKREEEERRRAEDERKAAAAEAKKREEENKARQEEERRAAEAAAKKREEEQKARQEEERKVSEAAAEKRRVEDERRRDEEREAAARRAQEEEREAASRQEEERRKRQMEEREAANAEARRAAEAAAARDEARMKREEEGRRLAEEREAAGRQAAEAAAKQRAEEERVAAERRAAAAREEEGPAVEEGAEL